MATIKGWFTMNGMHIPIMEGQSRAEAAKKYYASKYGKTVAKLSSKTSAKKQNKFTDSYESLEKAADLYQDSNSSDLRQSAKDFYDKLGYTNIPTKISNNEFDKLTQDSKFGALERGYREVNGISTQEMITQFKNGDLYIGEQRAFGIGTYFGYGKDAHSIAKEYATYKEENILKAGITKEAKIITAADLHKRQNEFSFKSFKKANEISKTKGEDAADAYYNKMNKLIRNDDGIFAAALGYDAIDIPDAGYIVILNRGKVVINE